MILTLISFEIYFPKQQVAFLLHFSILHSPFKFVTSPVSPFKLIFPYSRSNNFYLVLLLLMLFLCTLPVAFTLVWIKPSWHCGPFSQFHRIYKVGHKNRIYKVGHKNRIYKVGHKHRIYKMRHKHRIYKMGHKHRIYKVGRKLEYIR